MYDKDAWIDKLGCITGFAIMLGVPICGVLSLICRVVTGTWDNPVAIWSYTVFIVVAVVPALLIGLIKWSCR